MFEPAIGYLWQEQLKRKIETEEVLTHWRALMSHRRSADYYRWLDKLDEFYRALSLVYPVMATKLISAWEVAGYRKLDELKGHKPWRLALCDKAGMISLESLMPLLIRSEKAFALKAIFEKLSLELNTSRIKHGLGLRILKHQARLAFVCRLLIYSHLSFSK